MKRKIAIQGVKGAFHEEAAIKIFGEEIEIAPCITFKELVEKIDRDEIELGIMAIENTISRTILDNLELIRQYKLQISAETYLRIKQNLAVVKGASFQTIREVQSHYMALNQCRGYFEKYPSIHLVESADTALSIKEVAEKGSLEYAAIGSKLAIEYYGLEMLAESIETNKENYTRFVIVSKNPKVEAYYNKVSLTLTLPHQSGSLSKVLNLLHKLGVNLTKIESVPIEGQPWEYRFYLDLIVPQIEDKDQIIESLIAITDELTVLGKYISRTEER